MRKTITEYLKDFKEDIPNWLMKHKKGDQVNIDDLFESRIVFYPGSYMDGSPIKIINKAHYAHVYFYSDYSFKKDTLFAELEKEDAIKGYQLIDKIDINEIKIDDFCYLDNISSELKIGMREHFYHLDPYYYLSIFERKDEYDDDHGAKRFAILHMCKDAFAIYDWAFVKRNKAPDIIILQDHAFGGNYNSFGGHGLMHNMAKNTNIIPKYAICANNTEPWDCYRMLYDLYKEIGGCLRNPRALYQIRDKESSNKMVDIIPIWREMYLEQKNKKKH